MTNKETTQPMSREDAELLDKRIRDAVDTASDDLADVFDLLNEAKAGQTHEALGFTSWTAYAAERMKPITSVLSYAKRKELVIYLYDDETMSIRDTATALGLGKSAVGEMVRDVSGRRTPGSRETTTGHDGKKYRRRKQSPTRKQRRASITRAARDLQKIASRIADMTDAGRLEELDVGDLALIYEQLCAASADTHAAWVAVEDRR